MSDPLEAHYTVRVETETGSVCMIDVVHDRVRDTYRVEFAGELLNQSPEALTAAVQMALLAVRESRR